MSECFPSFVNRNLSFLPEVSYKSERNFGSSGGRVCSALSDAELASKHSVVNSKNRSQISGPAIMEGFKVPQTIPQDLLLIQGFIDAVLPSNSEDTFKKAVDDDISSSGSEDDDVDSSEEEIAADLTRNTAADDGDEHTKTAIDTCVIFPSSVASR